MCVLVCAHSAKLAARASHPNYLIVHLVFGILDVQRA